MAIRDTQFTANTSARKVRPSAGKASSYRKNRAKPQQFRIKEHATLSDLKAILRG